jgi:hypothetical protein
MWRAHDLGQWLPIMPFRARIDAPGALHHVICRGIERRTIFREDSDRDEFLKRLRAQLLSCRQCEISKIFPTTSKLLQ